MTILPRVATAGELTKIRSETQSSRLYMTVHVPEVVYSARVNGAPASNDKVVSVTYDGGSGTHTNILADQTLYVGTSAGAYDLGMSRIRNTTGIGATSGTFNIEITSEIQWADNAYLTVVDEFALRPRWPYTDAAGELFMDYDVDYVNQHRYCASFPIFPRYAVRWLPSGLITGDVVVIRDGSQSWALNNTINAYAWAAPGNSGISGDTTNTVTINYDTVNAAAGYRIALTVSNTDSVSFTGYGRVFVLREESDAITQFTIDRLSGSQSEGGWTAEITCYAEADPATIRDRAMVIIHRKDWYGTTEGSVGYVADDENIEMIGWIDGETIEWMSEDKSGSVSFSVKGPQFWLDRITMPTIGLKNKSAHPTNWKRFWGLSAKSAIWHLLMWRTTAPRMMDCFMVDNGYATLQLQSGGAKSIWEQMSNILDDFLLAKPCCDAYARLFMEVEQQCLSQAARSSIPTVMTITTGDWSNKVDFTRREVNEIAEVDITGEVYDGVHALTNVYALCPGRVFSHQGSSVFSRKSLVVDTQATLNTLAGAIYGWKNNPYPNWRFIFPSNLHLIDVAPHQYLSVTVNTADTPRGLTSFTKRLIPREIRRVWKDGYFETQATVEAEALIGVGITGDTPPDPPEVPASPPTPYIPPDPVPTPSGNATEIWLFESTGVYWSGDVRTGGQLAWNKVAGAMPDAGALGAGFVTADGSAIYLIYPQNANAGIYRCANPKDATPIWTDILAGQTSGSYPYKLIHGNWDVGMYLNTLWCAARADGEDTFYGYHFGTYNGTSWTWTAALWNSGTNRWAYSWYNAKGRYLSGPGGSFENDFWSIPGETMYSGPAGYYVNAGNPAESTIHCFTASSIVSLIRTVSAPVAVSLYLPLSGTVLTALPNWGYEAASGKIRGNVYGSLEGNRVFLVNDFGSAPYEGQIWIGDTSGVTLKATWEDCARIHDAAKAGGGTLWATLSTAPQSAEIIRASYDDGDTWTNLTGDFWSLTSGTQTFVGSGMVYV